MPYRSANHSHPWAPFPVYAPSSSTTVSWNFWHSLSQPISHTIFGVRRLSLPLNLEILTQQEANLFCKEPNRKYFSFCEPCDLCCNFPALPLLWESSHRQDVWKQCDCVPIKLYLQKLVASFGPRPTVRQPLIYIGKDRVLVLLLCNRYLINVC